MPDAKPTILMVEDDLDIAYILKLTLEREGYEIVHAADGRDALDLVRSIAPPRLALLDVMLPRLDGILLITFIRSRPDWADVPVVMLTAKTEASDVFQAISAGANSYIAKPFLPLALVERLRPFLNRGLAA